LVFIVCNMIVNKTAVFLNFLYLLRVNRGRGGRVMNHEQRTTEDLHKADYFIKKDNALLCTLCPQACLIHEGKTGLCSVRYNKGQDLYALTYSRISSQNLDPVEKKPLNHFYPGSYIFSIGSMGCNLGCPFCQNWQIAKFKDFYPGEETRKIIDEQTYKLKPQELINKALSLKDQGNIGIAYTYNEPFIWFEYVKDCAILARKAALKNVLVTNGLVFPKPLKEILPFIDAMNIDLKGFSQSIYSRLGGKLAPVKNTIKTVANSNCHLEVTSLLVTGLNDDLALFKDMIDWLADVAGSDTPLHISRYFPAYKYNQPPTAVPLIEKAAEIASKKLKYVYLGNV
jgi:pyruvate formate lyase activating enzyme